MRPFDADNEVNAADVSILGKQMDPDLHAELMVHELINESQHPLHKLSEQDANIWMDYA